MNIVFLNSAKVDFDNKLDFSSISQLASIKKYDASTQPEILERVTGQDVIITKEMPVGRDIIEQLPPSVKLICEAGTGYNNIDIVAAREKNILVCNVPGYSTEAVAQLAITFMLNLSSSMTLQQNMIQEKNFDSFTRFLQVPHFEVMNKTLGVIGSGSIGRQVIKIAQSLGMKILVYNRTPKSWGDANIKSVSLEELLKNSDFVSIHCPLTDATKHMINKKA